MDSEPSYPETEDDAGAGSEREAHPRPRRWGTVVGIIVGILLLTLFVVLHVTGVMGPGSH
jgi:hypothetical protein